MNFLNNLDNLMKNKNITKKELANVLGISPATITMWFTRGCDNVNLSTVINIANYFGITIDELVNGSIKSQVSFSIKDFSKSELKAIKNFSYFLIENRLNYEIKDFSELEKDTKLLHRRELQKAEWMLQYI